MYSGKIIPIHTKNETVQPDSPALPVCQVKGQQYTVEEDTIIKHGKGSIRFKLPITSKTKQRRKQRKRVDKRRLQRSQTQRDDNETDRTMIPLGIINMGATSSCGQEDGPFIAMGNKSNKIFQMPT